MEKNLSQAVEKTKDILHADGFLKYLTLENIVRISASIISVVVFYALFRFIKKTIQTKTHLNLEKNTAVLASKTANYIFYILMAMYILGLFGVNLKALWGAAGVAGIAVGFAAQTSVSNFISGLFVLGEKSMKIGDVITVSGTTGTVESAGLLSVKIRTQDNLLVRIPNSSMINSVLTNHSTYKTTRYTFEVQVSYEADLASAMQKIKEIAEDSPLVLKSPAPQIFYDSLGGSLKLKLSVWLKNCDIISVKNFIYTEIVRRFRQENIKFL
ncbi:mechanosensitive ion channel family protein [Treponema sp.]|uniref:mechanosensitive ion channel family protein n=1 Tax=Treponema sp. TaxID=166 RepID=UPI003F066C3D